MAVVACSTLGWLLARGPWVDSATVCVSCIHACLRKHAWHWDSDGQARLQRDPGVAATVECAQGSSTPQALLVHTALPPYSHCAWQALGRPSRLLACRSLHGPGLASTFASTTYAIILT